MAAPFHVVTGAFGFSGRYIAARLLSAGIPVRTLTHSTQRASPLSGQIEAHPYNFDYLDRLVESLRGAAVLYNTYWVRFNQAEFSHALAVRNTLRLFEAARRAGVPRVVHLSITNPSINSPLEYFRGKAQLERALIESGLSYAILRPAVLFGPQDILINNIAWMLRKFPVFGVFGDGRYRLQPIYVEDLAHLAVTQALATTDTIIDAIGPETFTYRQLVKSLARIMGKVRPVISIPPWLGFAAGWLLGRLLRDQVITRDEIKGLMLELLYTTSPPAGTTRLTMWAAQNADTLGRHYASELARRRDRLTAYEQL